MPDPQNPQGLAPRPGGPADPDYKYQDQFQSTAGQYAATPPDPVAPLGESQVVAMVMQKAMSGQPLNPQEQAVFDRQTALPQDPVAAMMALGAGVPGAAPGGYPQAGARQPGAQAGGQGQPYQPRDAADLRANVPVGGQYINPADGRVLTRTQ